MRTLKWLAIPVIALALVGTACGGDDDGDSSDTTATAAEATGTATATATATATGEASGGDDIDLASAFAGFQTASFNVTYNLEGGSGADAMTGEWTWIQDIAGNRTRFEVASDGQNIVMITTDEQTIVCVKDEDESDGACFNASGAMGSAVPNIGETFTEGINEEQTDASGGTVRRIDGRTIAGVDTECVEFESPDGVKGTACYTEDGIPLLFDSTTAEGNFRLEAVEFSTDISDGDFEAPFPITSIGG